MAAVSPILLALFSWSILLVVSRTILVETGLDPWLFTFLQMMAGGLILMILGGWRQIGLSALKDPFTWGFGVLRVLTAAFFTAALVHTTAANASFVGIIVVPLSMAVLFACGFRQPTLRELPGQLIVLTGLWVVVTGLEGGFANPALVYMVLSEICVILATLISELHPMNQTEDMRQRAGLTGVMLFAASICMLGGAIALSLLGAALPTLAEALPAAPEWIGTPSLLLDPTLWIAAILVGALLRGTSQFLSLRAVYRVGTENYLAGIAALPFMSLGLEFLFFQLGLIDRFVFAWQTVLGGIIMTSGSLLVLFSRRHTAMRIARAR